MGFRKSWDIQNIQYQINSALRECTSHYNDGFSQWEIKKELYTIKWLVDDALKKCPNFSLEDEWIREQSKERLIKILKDDIQQN
jgi:hypothetical protein